MSKKIKEIPAATEPLVCERDGEPMKLRTSTRLDGKTRRAYYTCLSCATTAVRIERHEPPTKGQLSAARKRRHLLRAPTEVLADERRAERKREAARKKRTRARRKK